MGLIDLGATTTRNKQPAVDIAGLYASLNETVAGDVRFDPLSRALYSTDASVYQIMPAGVVIPRSEGDVIATIAACNRFKVPITARGGGTSQAGQAVGRGIQLDFSKYLNEILEINTAQRWARVQPGCVLDDLNLKIKPLGLQFAPDVSTSNRATIGGMIANNSSGSHSIIYGKTIDHVLEMKVALANGTVLNVAALDQQELDQKLRKMGLEGDCYRGVQSLATKHSEEIDRRFPKILRRVGGYNLDSFQNAQHDPSKFVHLKPFNLANLLVGSEGTLAITLEAKLRLIELPRAKALLVIHFEELLNALAAVPTILRHEPAAIELLDRYILESTRLNAEAARLRGFLQGDPGAVLIVEFYADHSEELPPRLHALAAQMRSYGWGYQYVMATDTGEQARIWKLRKAALGLSMAQKGDAKALSFVEDTAVSPMFLRDYIGEFLEVVTKHGTTAGVYAHASVGCLHVRPIVNLKTAEGVTRFEGIADDVSSLVLKYGGALSGEHGDGLVRSPFQEKLYGSVLYNAFRELKRTFDPENLLNPGKVVDAPPLAANLRYGPTYVTPILGTTFDFSADGGIVRAAELCSGVGACRKQREGIMCPSFQATREEKDSTRGRANALRLAMTNQLGPGQLTNPALMDALDLCLECKACKSECPTNVDMARLKAEFLHQYYKKFGLPLRNRLFGNVGSVARLGSRMAPLSNWASQSIAIRWLGEKLFGIDRRRLPPKSSRTSFSKRISDGDWFGAQNNSSHDVLMFVDTFTNFYEPSLGMSAISLLDQMKVGVHCIAPNGSGPKNVMCCGRPLISNGMLDKAVDNACHNIDQLYPWAAQGKAIFACEPSCILTIKDDYPALMHGEMRRKAEVVSRTCKTFEELMQDILKRNPGDRALPRSARSVPGRLLVQAHCHQRSLVGTEALLQTLRLLPGTEVIDLEAGCCGMAGSFGYEKEHYEISRLVGEQRLFPRLGQASPDDVIVAPGFSCRMQIKHFVGRNALHPAEVLWNFLGPN